MYPETEEDAMENQVSRHVKQFMLAYQRTSSCIIKALGSWLQDYTYRWSHWSPALLARKEKKEPPSFSQSLVSRVFPSAVHTLRVSVETSAKASLLPSSLFI